MNTRGSEWRKWDLHIHSSASDGKLNCYEIIELAQQSDIKCIAITDHHTFDNVDKIKTIVKDNGIDITVISGVEFRTEYGNKSVHMIGLFPDNYNGIELTSNYLHDNVLSVLGISRSKIIEEGRKSEAIDKDKDKDKTDDYYFKKGWNLVQVEFKKAADLIHAYGGLVSVHAGSKTNSIDEEMKHDGNSSKNVSIYDSLGPVKEELFTRGYIDICEIRNYKDGKDFYWNKFHKPSITASDTHEREDFGRGCCWIKADCNLEGLRQILEEPDRISFSKPDLLNRVELKPTKFINNITIKKKDNSLIDETWYENTSIDINPGLVAIIGNKGSGKSAVTDIIGLCANTYNDRWSFLTKHKFRMPRPYNRSTYFKAQLKWYDGSTTEWKTLDEDIDRNKPERVKYIPQNFLEDLCTTEDEKVFEKEMKAIIFQYLPENNRYGKQSLDDIVNYLSDEINSVENDIKQKIERQNEIIISIENKKNPNYKTKLLNLLELKKNELENLQKIKPIEIQKPDHSDNAEEKQKQEEIANLREKENEIDNEINISSDNLNDITIKIQDLYNLSDNIERLKQIFDDTIESNRKIFDDNGLNIEQIISLVYNRQIIIEKIQSLQKEKNNIEIKLDANNENSLVSKKLKIKNIIEEKEKKLGEPELLYQKYLNDLKYWKEKENSIIGSKDIPDTILFYENELEYIDKQLDIDINSANSKRKELVLSLLDNKRKVLNTYTSLYEPISKFIQEFKEDLKSYPIALDAAFIFDNNFGEQFFNIVNQQVLGSFSGREQGMLKLKELCDNTDLNENEAIFNFVEKLNSMLKEDCRDGFSKQNRDIDTQLKKGHTRNELYKFIYELDYIKPLFQLKLSGKELSALSPGERGALLLLFYLFIDMDDKPLIIDQPEENLDNESVYEYLVKFIKKAKTKRQIIIVTHNPNLAVVCDADQVIKMDIDKENKNAVSFISGAIENSVINKCLVDILEGTYPAFHNRDSKYFKHN